MLLQYELGVKSVKRCISSWKCLDGEQGEDGGKGEDSVFLFTGYVQYVHEKADGGCAAGVMIYSWTSMG
jgi:hypothetical protein